MKRFFLIALIGSVAAFSAATAQNAKPYLGGGIGFTFISGGSGGAFTFHGGADNLLGSLGLRGVGVIRGSSLFHRGCSGNTRQFSL